MASKVIDDEEIGRFKSSKRFKIDEYFKGLMNRIDIKVAETTSAIAAEATSSTTTTAETIAPTPSTSTQAMQMENLERVGKRLVDEIEKINNYNLTAFESNFKEILAIFMTDKSLEDSDEINKLVFKQFCFLHNLNQVVGDGGKREVKSDDTNAAVEEATVSIEEHEAIAKLKLKLVIADWYLNSRQLDLLKWAFYLNRLFKLGNFIFLLFIF
jgi:hypothetical protein